MIERIFSIKFKYCNVRSDKVLNLIKKDMILMKKALIILIPILMVVTFNFAKSSPSPKLVGYIFIVFFMSYYSYSFLDSYKNKSESMIINSFPVSRTTVLVEKYLLLIIYVALFSIISIIETNVMNILQVKVGNLSDIWTFIVSLNISLIYFSFFIPMSIKNNGDMVKLNIFMFVVIMILPQIIKRFLALQIGQKLLGVLYKIPNIKLLHIIFLCIALGIYLISFTVSLKLYKNKDF